MLAASSPGAGRGAGPGDRRPRSSRRRAVAVALAVIIAGSALAGVAALGGFSGPGVPGTGALGTASPTTRTLDPAPTAPATAESISPAPTASPPSTPDRTITLGILLPMTGADQSFTTEPIRAAVELAVVDARERGLVPGVNIVTRLLDHGYGEGINPAKAIVDMQAFIDDPSVVGVVGPYYDPTARDVIPMAAEAGLVLCSPTNQTDSLTIGPDARLLQPDPGRRVYLRTGAPDHAAGTALARHAFGSLEVREVVVGSDGSEPGRGLLDAFTAEFEALGGEIRGSIRTDDGLSRAELRRLGARGVNGVVIGSADAGDAYLVRTRMNRAGLRDRIVLGGPELSDGNRTVPGSFARRLLAGDRRPGPVYTVDRYRLDFAGEDDFKARLQEASNLDPGVYGPAGYACAETILNAVAVASATGEITRENVRAAATARDTAFFGLWGYMRFDANGDILPEVITVWRIDAGSEDGWWWDAQVEFFPR